MYFKFETLKNIVELFGVFKFQEKDEAEILDHSYVRQYLSIRFSKKVTLQMLDYYQDFVKLNPNESKGESSECYNDVLYLAKKLYKDLSKSQKVELYIALLDYVVDNEVIIEDKANLDRLYAQLKIVEKVFDIPANELEAINGFLRDDFENFSESVIVVGNFKRFKLSTFHMFQKDDLKGNVTALYVNSLGSFLIRYDGTDELYLNKKVIFPERVYQFSEGGVIEGVSVEPVYFSDLLIVFKNEDKNQIDLVCHKISKTFKGTNLGVKELSFKVESSQLMAVMGGSGTGKTTLFRLMSGSEVPDMGNVYINGYELFENIQVLKKHIGYVPQEDLLVEELTVYQNLLYSAQLCRNDKSDEGIAELVNSTLKDLGLYKIKDLKVGSPLDKVISGGQRKRLNIALELMRKPSVLFVDEPTSGLSSSDSLMVMKLLKRVALQGKIVIVNIHQPTSDIFFLLDKLLLLDENGYAAYFGNPLSASGYFKKHLGFVDSIRDDSVNYQQFNPEQLIQLIEYKKTSQDGEPLPERKIKNTEWHDLFIENCKHSELEIKKSKLSEGLTFIPSVFKQFVIFFKRNIMTRIADFQYMIMVMLGAPFLALLMSVFLKYTDYVTHEYHFSANDNLPVYLFISIIVSMFLGLIISSGEIFRDLKIIKRESFLSLSPFAYLNSKFFYVLIVDAIQIVLFVIVGNTILEIKGLFWQYVLILWVTAVFSSMLGLFISTRMKTVLSIYIMIPFLLIPQILLAGAILDFDKIHHLLASKKYVPVYADVNVSRWAYEALVVLQFNENEYEKDVSDNMIEQSEMVYYINFVIPKLETLLGAYQQSDDEDNQRKIGMLIDDLVTHYPDLKNSFEKLSIERKNLLDLNQLVKKVKKWLRLKLKDSKTKVEALREANKEVKKEDYFNQKLADFVLQNGNFEKFRYIDGEMIRKYQPGYYVSECSYGRSHYYAPYKKIGNLTIKTWVFNLYVMILAVLITYIFVFVYLKRDKF
jgi:ABC-type multidrug transport system ATPase subunit